MHRAEAAPAASGQELTTTPVANAPVHGEGLFDVGVIIGKKVRELLASESAVPSRRKAYALAAAWRSVQFGAASALATMLLEIEGGEEALKEIFGPAGTDALALVQDAGVEGWDALLWSTVRQGKQENSNG